MIYTADEQAMQEYSAIVQRIARLDFQRDALMQQLAEWEKAHRIEEPAEEPAPEEQ